METRVIKHVKIFCLFLNPMMGRMEERRLAAVAPSREELVTWANEQRAPEIYKEERYSKTYKKDGPLEWFNPVQYGNPSDPYALNDYGHGIIVDWIDVESYNRLPQISHGAYLVNWSPIEV